MSSIDNDTVLSAITVPGTHESLSRFGGPLAVCQVWSLERQLEVGVRFVDVHAGIWFPAEEHVYVRDSHWMFWQHVELEEVLETIVGFLRKHGSETVLLKVTPHGFYQERVKSLMKAVLRRYRDKMWTDPSVPVLKQVRGKVVLVQSEAFAAGIETRNSFFLERDQLLEVEMKIVQLKPRLCRGSLVVTDVAASRFRSPRTLAQIVNQQLYRFLEQHQEGSQNRGCLGVVSTSFPSAELIGTIVRIGPCDCGSETVSPITRPSGPESLKPPEPAPSPPKSGTASTPEPEPPDQGSKTSHDAVTPPGAEPRQDSEPPEPIREAKSPSPSWPEAVTAPQPEPEPATTPSSGSEPSGSDSEPPEAVTTHQPEPVPATKPSSGSEPSGSDSEPPEAVATPQPEPEPATTPSSGSEPSGSDSATPEATSNYTKLRFRTIWVRFSNT
ncbi:1-phosphatidylinositol phosphodiesterase-like [Betta splendens]|uniref:1-phosphatidylinositol phosphodiesterase-like n=1 Tax=Betta splendens TaxID=158456 RepID=A0A9W2Y4L4_BETSP|nr:1-phosphatidylinositol phosphodiesterase-like [Betta splendens]